MATTVLLDSGLPDTYWEDAMLCALYIYNRIPPVRKPETVDDVWMSPRKRFYKNGPPTLDHLLPFGSKVVAFVPKELRGLKGITEQGQECILVGFDEKTIHGYI